MYGPSTVRQIIDGNHVKRGDAESYQRLEQVAIELSDACADGENIRVNKANAKMLETIESLGILKNMEAFQ